ncbi:hypothetical protein JCM11641_003936 [Rhodosporidiobolus odoratus]
MSYSPSPAHADPLRPSLFELAAQDQLRDLLSPVVRYVLSVFAQRHPRYLLRLVNHHDALFAVCMFFVEKHSLLRYGGSFAETFYGLKRRKVMPGGNGDNVRKAAALTGKSDRMGRREIRGSLVFLVLLPYLQTKLADAYERLGGGVDESLFASSSSSASNTPLSILRNTSRPLRERLKPALEAAFKLSYPHANLAYQLYLLVYNLRYLFSKSPFWRPWFRLIRVEVRRMGQEDYERLQNLPCTFTTLFSPPPNSPPSTRPALPLILSRFLRLTPSLALDSLRTLLPLTIFGFRLLEWWYSPGGGGSHLRGAGKAGSQPALRAPPAPPNEVTAGKEERGQCVVHGGVVENPTALPSGWVGCYRCLRGLEEEVVVLPDGREVSLDEAGEEAKKKERRKTGRLKDPKTGEWTELGRLRRIMG